MWRRRIALISFLTMISLAVWAENTINANSTSLADVTAAYNQAQPGDRVVIPAGQGTWSDSLTISKSITLEGHGATSTVIIGSGTKQTIIVQLSADVPLRITGIDFQFPTNTSSGSSIYVKGKTDGSFALTKFRIDHNKFEKGSRAVWTSGWVAGVLDHNDFVNCNIAVGLNGDNDRSWERPIQAGTSDALFIENNTFTIDNNTDREPNHQIYHQEGARSVLRYNIFDSRSYTNGYTYWYDNHGNWPYYTGPGTSYRGQPICEVYGNQFLGGTSPQPIEIRGGVNIWFNNTLSLKGSTPAIGVWEEEAWQTQIFSPLRTAWPAEDQIMNSFFWNNTANGALLTSLRLHASSESTFIQQDRDYFFHAPDATSGKAVYNTRQGAADETFVAGPNAFFPYTPFAYPHPLTISGNPPAPPTGLHLLF